mgnify:CR=1 FL=1
MGFMFKNKDEKARKSGVMDINAVTYDPNNIFIITKSEDGNFEIFRELFPSTDNFKIYFKNLHKNILIEKDFFHPNNQSLNVLQSAFSDFGFAAIVETYFNDNPHLVIDFFLYDNSGNELFHIYCESLGIKAFSFSESGRYLVLLDYRGFYVYDMELRALSTFSPNDFENSDSRDFLIIENKKCIAYQYTQHPDKPFYHFTFDGRLVEEDVFNAQIEKINAVDTDANYYALFDEIHAATRPLSEENYNCFLKALNCYLEKPGYNTAWLYREIGELELEMGKKKSALEYFEKALELNPQIGVKRITAKLQKELG